MVNADLFNNLTSSLTIRLVSAVAILLIGYIAARFISKLINKILSELETNRIIKEQAGVRVPVEEFSSHIIKYLIYFIAIIMALNQIGIATTTLQILLIVIIIILIIFIILALKDFIPNVVAGFLIYQKRKIKPGDIIKVKNIEGRVIHVNLTETRIKTKRKEIVYIPNLTLLKNELIKKNE